MGFDAGYYGRALYALRKLRGISRASELADLVSGYGIDTKERTIWAIERGEQIAGIDRHLAFCRILRPSQGYFEEALGNGSTSSG